MVKIKYIGKPKTVCMPRVGIFERGQVYDVDEEIAEKMLANPKMYVLADEMTIIEDEV